MALVLLFSTAIWGFTLLVAVVLITNRVIDTFGSARPAADKLLRLIRLVGFALISAAAFAGTAYVMKRFIPPTYYLAWPVGSYVAPNTVRNIYYGVPLAFAAGLGLCWFANGIQHGWLRSLLSGSHA